MKPIRAHSKSAGNPAPTTTASEQAVQPCAEERLSRIAVSTFYKAEVRGFATGCEVEDWLVAEAEEKSW